MSVKQFAEQMKSMIEGLQANGTTAIPCSNLITYLNEVQGSAAEPTPVEIERYKVELQSQLEANKQQHDHRIEMFRSVIAAGQHSTKSTFLLNGGGAVAMLAFIGHLAEIDASKVAAFAPCLLPFCIGVLTIVVANGFTYLTQFAYAKFKMRTGDTLNLTSILMATSSYVFFGLGIART